MSILSIEAEGELATTRRCALERERMSLILQTR